MCQGCMASAAAKTKDFKSLASNTLGVTPVEECRRCLEDGIFRRCCDNWYCNDCYYRIGECPSCGASTATKKKQKKEGTGSGKKEASLCQLLGTNGFKLTFWIMAFGWPFVWFINKIIANRTLHGFQCEGLFPQCKYEMCVSLHEEMKNSSMPYFKNDNMPECGSQTQCRRMCSKACVFDDRMFSLSHGKMGIDLCTSYLNDYVVIINDDFESLNEVTVNNTVAIPNSMERDINAQYQQNDEYLSSNWNVNAPGNPSIRESAFWSNVVNGNPDRMCGRVHGVKSLVFTGQLERYAETVDLNIEYGANISFGFKFGGYINTEQQPTHPECREAIRTPLFVRWSNNQGLTWNNFKFQTTTGGGAWLTSFDESYITEFMNNVTIEIDEKHAASTRSTRFRWEQQGFQTFRDFWAIDNVTVIAHTLPRQWDDSEAWNSAFDIVNQEIKGAQCCYGSSQCPTWHSEALDPEVCSEYSRWVDRVELRATSAEVFTPHWFFLGVVGVLWGLLVRKCIPVKRCMGRDLKGSDRWGSLSKSGLLKEECEKNDLEYLIWNSKTKKNMEVVEFMTARDKGYQTKFFIAGPVMTLIFCAGAVLIGITRPIVRVDVANNLQGPLLEEWAPEAYLQYWIETHLNVPGMWLGLVAAVLDWKDAWYIGTHCVGAFGWWKKHTPTRVQVYHHKGNITADDVQKLDRLVIDGDELGAIPIGKIKKIETATARYTKQLAFTCLLGAMPWACCLQILSRWLPDGIGLCWGVLVALKALTGPHFFSKLLLMYPYFFDMADEHLTTTALRFGRSRCLILGFAFAVIETLFGWTLVLIYFYAGNDNILSLMPDYLLWSFAAGLFVLFFLMGSILGWARDLPVEPWVYITGFEHMGRDLEPTIITYTRDDSCFVNDESRCYRFWTQDTSIFLSVTDNFNFSEALKGEHLDYDRPEERVVLKLGRRANVVLDLDYITFARDEEVLTDVISYDLAHLLETVNAEIIIEDYYKKDKLVCITFSTKDERAMEILAEYDTAELSKAFPTAGKYKLTEELKAVLREKMTAHPWKHVSDAYGYPVTPVDRVKVYNIAIAPMFDGYKVMEHKYRRPKVMDNDSDEDSFDAQLAEMDHAHDKAESARKLLEHTASSPEQGSDGSPGSPSSPGTSPGYGSPGWTGSGSNMNSSPGSGVPSPNDLVGQHWNAGGHEYPVEVRQMLAEIEESIGPDRPLQCTRPWCRAHYTKNHNRSDACLYHPGEVRVEMRPKKEEDMIALLGDKRIIPRDTGRHEDYTRNHELLSGSQPEDHHSVEAEMVEWKVWTCCGQPYVDLHSMTPTNDKGKMLSVGKHGQHRGKTSSGFKFREGLPCTRCPHF